jgi:hypothetical protein
LGSVGEALFWAAFLLLGCGGAVAAFSGFVVPEWRVNHEFVETTCKVLDKRVAEKQGEDGPLYRPEIKIEYEVDGVTFRDWHYDIHRAYANGKENAENLLKSFVISTKETNARIPCWYDPMNPGVAVLMRDYRWWVWLVFTVPLSFMVIGAGGLIYTLLHWGKSAERRAAMSQNIGERDFFGANSDPQRVYPFVPQGANMTNSPGTRLRYRLPFAGSPGWALFGTLVFCVIWNGTISAFLIYNHMAGKPEWTLTLFMIPFVLVGIGAIVMFFRLLLINTGIGPTLMEISDHPLQPGGQYRLFISQSGRFQVKALRVALACEESATYRQGTNTRTETQEVYCKQLFRREGFEVENGLPFETEIDLEIPEGVMHSFKAAHNEINWVLTVEGNVLRWPDFKRRFSLIVRPRGGEDNR